MENLQHLVGYKVRIFRGGPESRDGILVDEQPEYVALLTEDEGIVYYNLLHIKSVIKNSKDGQIIERDILDGNEESQCIQANSFHDLLQKLKHCRIRIDRGGPESRTGNLLDVFSDFLVLQTEKDGIIYYKTHHIKSVSQMTKEQKNDDEDHEEECRYVSAMDFQDLLAQLQYSWVKINRGGPEKIEGVLVDSSEDYLVLTVNDEVNRIPSFHIRNISVVENKQNFEFKYKQEKDEDDEEISDDKDESEEKQDGIEDQIRDEETDESYEDGENVRDEKDDEISEEERDEPLSEHESEDEDENESQYDKHYNPPGPVWYNKKIKFS